MPEHEEGRLSALQEYQLLDTKPEYSFDRLTKLAARLFDVPIVLISLVDRERQFFKSHIGLDVCETGRDLSFCAHAILQDDTMIVPDALADPRFADNGLVTGEPFIRFYAGKPLVTADGFKLGTVCLIDRRPRYTFSEADVALLGDIAELVMEHMEVRRANFLRIFNQARFESIAQTSADAIVFADSKEHIVFWNTSAEHIFGYTAAEVLNRPVDLLLSDHSLHRFKAEMDRVLNASRLSVMDRIIEMSARRKDGTEFPAEFSLSVWKEAGEFSSGAVIRDITERREHEERLFRLASLDPLTDLPNRNALRACLDRVLAEAGQACTLLLMDLDRFKEINDTLGHSVGDDVLKQVTSRLLEVCRDAIKVARLGGDEFVVLLSGDDQEAARRHASEIITTLSAPYHLDRLSAEIGVSVGIAMAPVHSQRSDTLMNAADLALYRAKQAGKGTYAFFEPALREAVVKRRSFEKELKRAFIQNEFELFYQPQFSTDPRRLTGAEALIRWRHPDRGLLSPISFIDILSHKPSAPEIGEWILRTACQQAVKWRKNVPDFTMGVNLFEAQFRNGDLPSVVEKALTDTGLPAVALELEIVENILLHDDLNTLRMLKDLRALGVGLAFDDYGTGFASLSLLKRFPVSRLKIDRTFVRDADIDPEDEAVIRAILFLGRSFGMEVIAEGVETEAQFRLLRQMDCHHVQGYLFGKPVSPELFEQDFLAAAVTG